MNSTIYSNPCTNAYFKELLKISEVDTFNQLSKIIRRGFIEYAVKWGSIPSQEGPIPNLKRQGADIIIQNPEFIKNTSDWVLEEMPPPIEYHTNMMGELYPAPSKKKQPKYEEAIKRDIDEDLARQRYILDETEKAEKNSLNLLDRLKMRKSDTDILEDDLRFK